MVELFKLYQIIVHVNKWAKIIKDSGKVSSEKFLFHDKLKIL